MKLTKENFTEIDGMLTYTGDIITEENLEIEVDALVKIIGNIEVKGNMTVKGSYWVTGYEKVRGSQEVGGWQVVGRYQIVGGWQGVGDSQRVVGYQRVGGERTILGVKTKYCIFVASLRYPIYILSDHIKIGCEFHTREKWVQFTDDEIASMDSDALGFWKKYKNFILTPIGEE